MADGPKRSFEAVTDFIGQSDHSGRLLRVEGGACEQDHLKLFD